MDYEESPTRTIATQTEISISIDGLQRNINLEEISHSSAHQLHRVTKQDITEIASQLADIVRKNSEIMGYPRISSDSIHLIPPSKKNKYPVGSNEEIDERDRTDSVAAFLTAYHLITEQYYSQHTEDMDTMKAKFLDEKLKISQMQSLFNSFTQNAQLHENQNIDTEQLKKTPSLCFTKNTADQNNKNHESKDCEAEELQKILERRPSLCFTENPLEQNSLTKTDHRSSENSSSNYSFPNFVEF